MLHDAHVWGLESPCSEMRSRSMSRGSSGRIVVEVDPALKKRLYAALSLDGATLKDWFRKRAEVYLASHRGLAQEAAEEPPTPWRGKRRRE